MRLQLSISRNELPTTKIIWDVPDQPTYPVSDSSTNSSGSLISDLVKDVHGVIPLEAGTWGFEDYIVELDGFECLHHQEIRMMLRDGDAVVIRPMTQAELRRKGEGQRHQINSDGIHLMDGIPYGKRFTRKVDRPEVYIQPRGSKRRKLLADGEYESSEQQKRWQGENHGQDPRGNSGMEGRMISDTAFNGEEDSEEDGEEYVEDGESFSEDSEESIEETGMPEVEDRIGDHEIVRPNGHLEVKEEAEFDDADVAEEQEEQDDHTGGPANTCFQDMIDELEAEQSRFSELLGEVEQHDGIAEDMAALTQQIMEAEQPSEDPFGNSREVNLQADSSSENDASSESSETSDDESEVSEDDDELAALREAAAEHDARHDASDVDDIPDDFVEDQLEHAQEATMTLLNVVNGTRPSLRQRALSSPAPSSTSKLSEWTESSSEESEGEEDSESEVDAKAEANQFEGFSSPAGVAINEHELSSEEISSSESESESGPEVLPSNIRGTDGAVSSIDSSNTETSESNSPSELSDSTSGNSSDTSDSSESESAESAESELSETSKPEKSAIKPQQAPSTLASQTTQVRPVTVAPGNGSRRTQKYNRRAKRRKILNELKQLGILPKDANLAALDILDPALIPGDLFFEDKVPGTVAVDADFEARRQELLRRLDTGGGLLTGDQGLSDVEDREPVSSSVQPAIGSLSTELPEQEVEDRKEVVAEPVDTMPSAPAISSSPQMPDISPTMADFGKTPLGVALSRDDLSSRSSEKRKSPDPTLPEDNLAPGSASKRARLDKSSASRHIWAALGHRAPKNAEDAERLRTKLEEKKTPLSKTGAVKAKSFPEVDDDWQKRINLSAVECWNYDTYYPPPPFPFKQRWHEQEPEEEDFYANDRKEQDHARSLIGKQPDGGSVVHADSDAMVIDQDDGQIAPNNSSFPGHVEEDSAAEQQLTKELQINNDEVEAEDTAIDLPQPENVSDLEDLIQDEALPGAVIAYKEFELLNGQAGLSDYRVARVEEIFENGDIKVVLSKRDYARLSQQLATDDTNPFAIRMGDDHDDLDDPSRIMTFDEMHAAKIVSGSAPSSQKMNTQTDLIKDSFERESPTAFQESNASTEHQPAQTAHLIPEVAHDEAGSFRKEINSIVKEVGLDSGLDPRLQRPITKDLPKFQVKHD